MKFVTLFLLVLAISNSYATSPVATQGSTKINASDSRAQVDLMWAIKRGDVPGVQKALSEITDIESAILDEEFTPLQYASLPSNNDDSVKRQILQLLLAKYSKVNAIGFGSWQGYHRLRADWPPLMIAYAYQSRDFINDLTNAGAKLDVNYSLFAAAMNQYPDLTEKLIKSGANVNFQIWKHQFEETTPLMVASDLNMDVLLTAGANPNLVDHNGDSPLMSAINLRKFDTNPISVKPLLSLIKAGANLNQQNKTGDTALIYSVLNDQPEVTDVLLSAGASTEIKNNKNETALYISSDVSPFWQSPLAWNKPKKLEIANLLVKYGAKAESALLVHTFFRPDADYTKVLLSSGVNVNVTSKDGSTPLIYTVQDKYASDEVAKALVDHGANVNFRNVGMSVLDYAVRAGDIKKITVLKDSGVLIDDQDPTDGHTATMFAASWNEYESVEYLISVGANLNLKDKAGKTALDYAASSEVKNLIRKAGGLPGAEIPAIN